VLAALVVVCGNHGVGTDEVAGSGQMRGSIKNLERQMAVHGVDPLANVMHVAVTEFGSPPHGIHGASAAPPRYKQAAAGKIKVSLIVNIQHGDTLAVTSH